MSLCLVGFPLFATYYQSELSENQIVMHTAIVDDDQWKVWELLADGFDLRQPLDREGTKILSFAAAHGRADIVQSLLEDHIFLASTKNKALGITLEQGVYDCPDCMDESHDPFEHLDCLALLIKVGAVTTWLYEAAQEKKPPMYTLDCAQDVSMQKLWLKQRLRALKLAEKQAQEMSALIKPCKDQRLRVTLKNPKRILILD